MSILLQNQNTNDNSFINKKEFEHFKLIFDEIEKIINS